MDPAYVSTLAALLGSLIGGSTSFLTAWFLQRSQARVRHDEADRSRREAVYGAFIKEASRLYGDALSHEKDDVMDLVDLYALVNQMRLFSSRDVVACAERTIATIVDTYLAPNIALSAMARYADGGGMNPLQAFGEACRREFERPVRSQG